MRSRIRMETVLDYRKGRLGKSKGTKRAGTSVLLKEFDISNKQREKFLSSIEDLMIIQDHKVWETLTMCVVIFSSMSV